MLFQKTFLPYCDKASPYCFLQLCEARHAKPIFPLWQTIRPRKINSILIKRNQTGQRNALTSKQQGDLLGARNQKVFTERKYSHMFGCHIANTMDWQLFWKRILVFLQYEIRIDTIWYVFRQNAIAYKWKNISFI